VFGTSSVFHDALASINNPQNPSQRPASHNEDFAGESIRKNRRSGALFCLLISSLDLLISYSDCTLWNSGMSGSTTGRCVKIRAHVFHRRMASSLPAGRIASACS
jgi:hypothetical protein